MIFNPGAAQSVTVDLSTLLGQSLSASLFAEGATVPIDLLDPRNASGPPLAEHWTVPMGAGEVKAYGGFALGSFAPRLGKKASCQADDRYSRPALGTTMQQCLLECLGDSRCENVLVEFVEIVWMEQPPPLRCVLLGKIESPATGCQPGTGTLIKKLIGGRPGESAGD